MVEKDPIYKNKNSLKYLGINLIKNVQNAYVENITVLLRDIQMEQRFEAVHSATNS